MPDTYTIEPPPERRREMSRDSKLDRILSGIDQLLSDENGTDSGSGAPEVTFEAEPDMLPADPESNDPGGADAADDDAAGQGEGTTNVSDQAKQEGGFRFPGRRRKAMIDA